MQSTRRHPLDLAIVTAHCGLIAALGLTLGMSELDPLPRLLITALALLPLLLLLPGLIKVKRSVLPWLALALVVYVGLGTVEVIATRTVPASALLLLALVELGLAISLRRLPQP